MSANDRQINGSHYQGAIQTWDYIVANDLSFLEGNIIKYVTRFRKKNGIQDLEKARHYLDKLIEVEHERLRRASNTNVQNQQTIASIIAESENRYGERISTHVSYRNEAVTQLRDRTETGYGQPQDLGDIT